MININSIKKTVLLTTLVLGVAACGHAPTTQEFAESASPGEELSNFDADMNTALLNQVDVLSPVNFKEAPSSLADAKKGLEKHRDSKDILHDIAEGRAYL